LIGSMSIQMILLRKNFAAFTRQSDVRIGLLREVVEKIQRGEDVDVEKVLGTGDLEKEAEWQEGKTRRFITSRSKHAYMSITQYSERSRRMTLPEIGRRSRLILRRRQSRSNLEERIRPMYRFKSALPGERASSRASICYTTLRQHIFKYGSPIFRWPCWCIWGTIFQFGD
jgi:hypothetical protein